MTDTEIDARAIKKSLAAYQEPCPVRSTAEIAASIGPLALIWGLGWIAAVEDVWWLALALSVPGAGFVLRMFLIQHDCGHRAFYRSGPINDWVGRAIGVLTLTPYDCWRREHAIHHASSGNLDRRGPGAIHTVTVEEYRAMTPLGRVGYRLYRNPIVLFVLGPLFVFFFQQRLPVGLMKEGWRPWISAMGTNVGMAAVIGAALWFGGWKPILFVYLPSVMLAASIGVWLFFVQHQFETTHWSRSDEWNVTEAALKGSSHLHLPGPLAWLSANIGIHHVHHAASRIPFYRLQNVLKDHPKLKDLGRISLLCGLRSMGLALWDETSRRLISFRQYRELHAAA